jgi:hypothetical protein
MRRKTVVRQRFPVRQQADAQIWSKPGNFREQALRVGGIGRQHGEHALPGARGGCRLGDQQRVG